MAGYNEEWVVENQQLISETYREAGQALDLENTVWNARMAHDAAGPLEPRASREKHLNELRVQLGLSALPIQVGPLSRISVRPGVGFYDQLDREWIWKGCTDFLLYKRYLEEGADAIRPVLLDRRYVGANILRVLLMARNITRFYPQDYGERFFSELVPFSILLEEYEFYWEPVVFADAQYIIPRQPDQILHWYAVTDPLKQVVNALPELVNEYPQNGVRPDEFQHPGGGLVCSRGSGLSNEPPYRPGWDFFGWHGRRDWPKVTSSTVNMFYMARGDPWADEGVSYPPIVGVHDEPIGFAEHAIPDKRSNDPQLALQLGASCRVLGSGGTLHSDDGILSRPFGGRTQECAQAFFMGLSA